RHLIEKRLYRFLNPVIGGQSETGWPFGRDLYIADIYFCLREFSDEAIIQNVSLFKARSDGSILSGSDSAAKISVSELSTIASGKHQISIGGQ
ncbi:MAG: putative baseplate assembly protein, partial [Chloroflexota bacterium]